MNRKLLRVPAMYACLSIGLLLFSRVGLAVPIIVDPGAVGSVPISPTFTLDNTNVDANNAFDIVFADMKHIELVPNDYFLGIFGGTEFDSGGPYNYSVYLSDEHGNMIPGTSTNGSINQAGQFSAGAITVTDLLVFHDMHFDFESLPALPLDVRFGIGRFANTPQPHVGVWVPEPATLALLGLGLAGVGFSRRKAA